MQSSFFEFSAFQVSLFHTFVEFLPKFVEEVGAAIIPTTFNVNIGTEAVLGFHTKGSGKGIR